MTDSAARLTAAERAAHREQVKWRVLQIGRAAAALAGWHLWGGWGGLLAYALCVAANP